MQFFILFLFLLSNTHSQIVLNIKKEEKSDFYSNFFSELKTTFEIGNPIQTIESKITFSNNYFFIIGEGDNSYFNKEKSTTFKLGNKTDVLNLPFKEGYLSTDNFNFENVNGKKNKTNFNFLYALKPNKKENFYTQIGFSIFNSPHGTKYNLIFQLNKQKIINSYVYYFDFNKNYSKIVIGEYAEKYQSKTKSKLVTTQIDFVIVPEYIQIEFDNFIFGNNILDYKININFDFHLKGFIGNELFKKKVNELFFKDLIDKKICSEYTYKEYLFYECNSNLEIKKLPSVKFYHKDMNVTFEFNYNELFQKYNDKYYFMITFYLKLSDKWTFGYLFLEKYKTVINSDRRIIGFYIPNISNIDGKSFSWISILIIFILLSFVAGLSVYYYRLLKNKRKTRVNEIEEDIDYTPVKK